MEVMKRIMQNSGKKVLCKAIYVAKYYLAHSLHTVSVNSLNPTSMLWAWQLINLILLGLGIFTLVKFLIVLFKVDRAIDEVREYIRRSR